MPPLCSTLRIDKKPINTTIPFALDILREILSALASESSVILATIISTSGSTPASAFSKMVVKNEGTSWAGTVGGGCMEGDVLEAARVLYHRRAAEIMTFSLNENDMVQGLICGGNLDVLIEPLTREDIPLIEEMKALRDDGSDCVIATLFEKGRTIFKKVLKSTGESDRLKDQWIRIASGTSRLPIDELVTETLKAHQRHATRRVRVGEGELILEPQQGRPHLVIFGGGHVSRYVSRTASMSGFRVTVVDDRKEYASPERFPEADETIVVEFYDAFNHLTVRPSTYIVIVTRGHRSDEEILEHALKTPAKYVGMIGSRRKVLATYQHLVERGASIETLGRVHAPVGLEIGAVTAEEIGVSVVAELIHIRRGAADPVEHMSRGMSGLLDELVRKKG